MRIVLETRLKPEECAERLRSSIDNAWDDFEGDNPVIGIVKGNRFIVRKRIWGFNAWQYMLVGQFDAQDTRTRIYAKSGQNIFARLMKIIIFSLFVVPLSMALVESLLTGSYQSWKLSAVLVFVVVSLFIAIPVLQVRSETKSDLRFLESYLKDTFEAEILSGAFTFPKGFQLSLLKFCVF